jgi:hypothetical protein
MIPSEFNARMRSAVDAHRAALAEFARTRALFRDLSSSPKPDWPKVGECLVAMAGQVDALVTTSRAIEALQEEFTGRPKINGTDPLPVVPESKLILPFTSEE